MAELLKRQYDLLVLKVELVRGADGVEGVLFTFQSKEAGELVNRQTWNASSAATATELPREMLNWLRDFFTFEVAQNQPLWVHLVAPYGALTFVAWERLLGDALDVPILMLPDFIFPPPLDTQEELEVVVCGSAPLDHEHWSVLDALHRTVERILTATGRQVRVHVFTDRPVADALRAAWTASSSPFLDATVLIHDPETAEAFFADDEGAPADTGAERHEPRGPMLHSRWLRWMQARLEGRAVDVVHFVCHGYLSRGRGAMLFAQSPLGRTDHFLAGPVTAAELKTFLTSIGAWATTFTSVADNASAPGLREVADGIAQSRPGPMLMASMSDDPNAEALAAGYGFLFGAERRAVPKSRALLIYCQPYLVAPPSSAKPRGFEARREPMSMVARNPAQAGAAERAEHASPLGSLYEGQQRVSSHVASTARFAEDMHLKYQKLQRDQIALPEQCDHESKIALDTVERLTRFVADRANKGTLA